MVILTMIFIKEDKLYHEAKKTCHSCGKTCVNKVRDHCHGSNNYRAPACDIRNLNYRPKISFRLYFIMENIMNKVMNRELYIL